MAHGKQISMINFSSQRPRGDTKFYRRVDENSDGDLKGIRSAFRAPAPEL